MNPRTKTIKETVEALIIALILALVIRTFFIQAFKIPSGSMLGTLLIGDHLLVNKILYGLRLPLEGTTLIPISDPKFQDIIVFKYPQDPSKDFIKRVIGIPGDTIEIRDKAVFRNGERLAEDYVRHTDPRSIPGPRDNLPAIKVPEGKYFVMGDNRDESLDSRFWGFVDRKQVLGRALVIYFSWETSITDIRWDRLGEMVHGLHTHEDAQELAVPAS